MLSFFSCCFGKRKPALDAAAQQREQERREEEERDHYEFLSSHRHPDREPGVNQQPNPQFFAPEEEAKTKLNSFPIDMG